MIEPDFSRIMSKALNSGSDKIIGVKNRKVKESLIEAAEKAETFDGLSKDNQLLVKSLVKEYESL